jgi:hypothetical protein
VSFERAQADDLRACIETGTSTFVLVDPIVGEPMPGFEYPDDADLDTLIAAREAVWERPVFVIPIDRRSMLGDMQSRYPYLVGLEGGRDDPWLGATLEMVLATQAAATRDGLLGEGNATFAIGGWLMTGMRAAELTDQLAHLFRPDTEALLRRGYYLRLPDPRLLHWVRRIVGEARLSAALGRIQHWYTVDMRGRLTGLHSLGETAMPLRFTEPEWRKLARGEEVHSPVAMALGAAVDGWRLPDDPYEGVSRALDLADAAAKRWPQRLADPRDRAAWAALCLLHGDPAGYDLVRGRMDAPPEEPVAKPVRRLAGTLDRSLRQSRSNANPTH